MYLFDAVNSLVTWLLGVRLCRLNFDDLDHGKVKDEI